MILRLIAAALLLAAAAPGPLATGPHEATVNGVRLWYRVAGPARGEPVVFLHGGPGEGSQTFATLAGPALERRGLRMIYLDQRGSGRSERPKAGPYSQDLLIEDLEQLRQHLGVPRMALVGHSYGTVIALEYAARYPERLSRMVLTGTVADVPAMLDRQCERLAATDPTAYGRATKDVRPDAMPRCQPFAAYEGAAGQAWVNRNMFPDPKIDALVTRTDEAEGLKNTGELSRAVFRGGFLNYRFMHPERLTMPVLFIAGGEDHQAVVEPTRALAARLPRARVVEYAGRGHFMFVEDPERFARDVSAFLRGR